MPKVKKQPKIASASVSGLSHEGRGIAHIDGKAHFLFNALPGENVEFQYTRNKSSYAEGKVTRILQTSEHRITPPCKHFDICGGCSLQHMKHADQLQLKEKTLLDLLTHTAGIQPKTLLAPLTANTQGYRRKARIGAKYVPGKNKVIVGFRERAGRLIADIHSCKVLHPSIGEKITNLSNLLYSLEIRSKIPQIEIAVGDDASAIILRHLQPLTTDDINKIKAFGEKQQLRVYLQPKAADSIHLIYPENGNELLSYHLPKHNLTLQFHPAQFTQINANINQLMINQAIELLALKQNDTVLDLFCGIGNFSLPLAQYCQQVIGIEGDTTAVKQATANAKFNSVDNVKFYSANLFEDISHTPWAKIHYDKILLDPPRSGAKEIIHHFKHWQPRQIIYVSCNPTTLARDAKLIVESGYSLQATGIMDMFPHTQHVETITSFRRNDVLI